MTAHGHYENSRRIHEDPIPGKRLGRHVLHDERSRSYPALGGAISDTVHNAVGLPLLQSRGSCTAEALCGALNLQPNFSGSGHHIQAQYDADKLYDEEIVLEGYDPKTDDPGGSGLVVCQAAKKAGLISTYRHAFGITHVLQALTTRPVIIGVDWYGSFDSPDPVTGEAKLDESSGIRGGHEIVLYSIDTARKTVGAWNSWGVDYGVLGRFTFAWDTLDFLLKNDGDATVPIPS